MKASIFEWSIHRKGTHKGEVRVHIKGKKERLHTKEEKGRYCTYCTKRRKKTEGDCYVLCTKAHGTYGGNVIIFD